MTGTRHGRPSLRGVERLARDLALFTKLSFDERQTFLFAQKARETIARTRAAYRALAKNLNERTHATQGVEVLLDNFYVVEGALTELLASWKQKETLRVPQSPDVEGEHQPRAYMVARALVKETDARVGRETIVEFLKAYQKSAPFSVRELDIFPDMLRFALVEDLLRLTEASLAALRERAEADRWYVRIVKAGRGKDSLLQLKKLTSLLADKYRIIPQVFGLHLLHRLAQTGKEGDIRMVSKWLKLSLSKQGANDVRLTEINARTEKAQVANILNSIISLRYLAQVRWDKISLELNMVDAVLAKDPVDAFSALSDETRGMYRRTIVRVADKTGTHDIEVAREAVRLARQEADSGRDETKRSHHVGYYLVDAGVPALEAALGYSPSAIERARAFIIKNGTRIYLGFIGAVAVCMSAALLVLSGVISLSPLLSLGMLIVGLLLMSEVGSALAHFLFTRVLEPKPLPALDLSGGAGESRRTIVAMPSMFRDSASAAKVLRRMETNFVANSDPDIFYALLMDLGDAPKENMAEDTERINEVARGVDALSARYPSPLPRFALFYRKRTWNHAEKVFMGWERKRGKLREFNDLLRGRKTTYAGDAEARARSYGRVRYVIALDEDTELVRDSARALIGTIDHPLNRPVIDEEKKVVVQGYGIIQPRSALRFTEGRTSAFSHLFGNFPGIDMYSSSVSDLHQDLFGEAIFHGKGIYDIDAIETTMAGRIPENRVLSHDLLEGLYARVGIASGAHIFEGFPSNYREHMRRLHRWIRGDWQIIGWLFRTRGGVFSPIARYRIFDNLRRSLLPIAASLAVMFSALSPADVSLWSLSALLALGSGALVSAILTITERTVNWRSSVRFLARMEFMIFSFCIAVVKTFLLGVFALHNAIIAADAIVRSMWRLAVSKKKLLEWQTAYEVAIEKNPTKGFLRFMWRSVSIAVFFLYLELQSGTIYDGLAVAWSFAWVSAPLFASLISIELKKGITLSKKDRLYLYTIAARTYWFFLDQATKEDQWLVSDHLQEEPPNKRHSHGLGISPTNLGMYLLSLSGGKALGLSSISDYCDRITRAFASMKKMSRHRGHFFNWYELKGLTPLAPRYVSSVDSANLALSLIAVRGALIDACKAPVIRTHTLEGLEAQLAVLRESCERILFRSAPDRNERKLIAEIAGAVGESLVLIQKALPGDITPRGSDIVLSGVIHHAVRIRNALEALRLEGKSERFDEIFLAARHTEVVVVAYRENISRYLNHAMVPAVSSVVNSPKLHELYLKLSAALQQIPSIDDLAEGRVRRDIESVRMREAIMLSDLPSPEKDRAGVWYAEVLERLSVSEKNAANIRTSLTEAAGKAGDYVKEMDFAFLYNSERGLFHIGYNDSTGNLDESFYDLLASEANSASIVGITKRDAPQTHWTYLGRKLIKSGAGDVLVASWAGSLFEYLGTLIYFDVPRESFWGISAQRAIAAHQSFAKRYNIPWGMGESASSRQDAAENYHYQAFGEPSLGYKRDLSESVVVAPYTSALALPFTPQKALLNFKRLAHAGGSGRYGFYDAIDFTERRRRENRGSAGVPARVYYAHHQGFILSSIVNVLAGDWVRKMVALDPEMEAATQLFEEKMPEDVSCEEMTAVVPQIKNIRHAPIAAQARRQYFPWRTKEALSLFLSSGGYHSRITTTGAGESTFSGVNITRESSDALRESVGTFFYLYDAAQKSVWSPTYMPTRDAGEKHAVSAGEQVVVFEKVKGKIATLLLATPLVSESGDLRELTLMNTGDTESEISFGVCAELSLSRSAEEILAPNYERLFVATESCWENQAIVASRPDPRDRTRTIAVGFLLVADGPLPELRAVREKEIFYGSPQKKDEPPILRDLTRADRDLPPHTLDSVAAFAGKLRLKPKETRRIALVTVAGNSKEEVLLALKRYRAYKQVRKTRENADEEGGRLLTEMELTPLQADTFSALASLALSRAMRSGESAGAAARPWVIPLWKMSIPGTHPIILLSVTGVTDLPVIRQILGCHSYFVKKGIAVDIVIFNNHSGGYLRTFEDEIDFLLNMHRARAGRSRSAVFHIRAEHLTELERVAVQSAATIRIDAKNGSLVDAVAILQRHKAQKYPPKLEVKSKITDAPYDRLDRTRDTLKFFNGLGGYDEETREYVVYSESDARPPRPWSAIVANERVGFLATDKGMSFTWGTNSRDNKLTVPYNDQLSEFTGEAIYVRDDETGACISPLPILGSKSADYEIRFGEECCTYMCRARGIAVELSLYVGVSEPVKYYRVRLSNYGEREKTLSLFGYFELLLGSLPRETKKHLSCEIAEGNTLVATQNYRHQFLQSRAFVGVVGGADEFTASREEFLGRHGDIRNPAALRRKGLSSVITYGEEPAAAFRKQITLPPGAEAVVTFFLGEADARDLARVLEKTKNAESDFAKARQPRSDSSLPKFELPDLSLAALVNRFLPHQMIAAHIRGRLGFHQISGAYGYRDQLQDALAMLWLDPEWVRGHILTAAAHQFREGDALSWWQPHNSFGVRTRLSDPQLWLPHVAIRYVRFTGDSAILDEVVPYLSGEIPDKAERPSVAGVFEPTDEKSSLYEHLIRAVEHSLTSGSHGLPLMGAADWNDGMSRIGAEGEGESVWLAWFTISILEEMSALTEGRGDRERAARYRVHAEQYREALKKFGWDGRWYRRAFTDAGVLVGTSGAKAFRLDSITQSWAYFVDGATKESRESLQSAKQELSIYEGHVPLAWPPSSRSVLDMGTISDYPPGVRENASQYNHAALWLAQALFAIGDADAGKVIIDAVNPLKRSGTLERAMIYQGEPYAVAAEIYSAPTYQGRAGWTWYTASAGVMYRAVIEYILGLKREGNRLSFTPSFPSGWRNASVVLPYGKSQYKIKFAAETDSGRSVRVSLDGAKIVGKFVTLVDDKRVHEIIVHIGGDVQ